MKKADLALAAAVVAGGAGLLALVAFGTGDGAPQPRDLATVAGVCEAARGVEVEDARTAFFDLAHDGLHELADRASDVDREIAGALLRDKERVETLLDSPGAPEQLRLSLRQLHESASEAATAVGSPEPEECP